MEIKSMKSRAYDEYVEKIIGDLTCANVWS